MTGSDGWPPGSDAPSIWRTLGFELLLFETGRVTVGWTASADYCFPGDSGPVLQGGLVTAVLDASMGGAAHSVLDGGQTFLTADLRVEFLRPARPGPVRATGTIVRRTRRVVFCSADLADGDGAVLATSRCTQVVLPRR